MAARKTRTTRKNNSAAVIPSEARDPSLRSGQGFSDKDPLSPVAGAVLYPHAHHRPFLLWVFRDSCGGFRPVMAPEAPQAAILFGAPFTLVTSRGGRR